MACSSLVSLWWQLDLALRYVSGSCATEPQSFPSPLSSLESSCFSSPAIHTGRDCQPERIWIIPVFLNQLYLYHWSHMGPPGPSTWQWVQQCNATCSSRWLSSVGRVPVYAFDVLKKALLSFLRFLLVFITLHLASQSRTGYNTIASYFWWFFNIWIWSDTIGYKHWNTGP